MFPAILVGTKCDLEVERKVSAVDGQNLAVRWNCPFREVSSKYTNAGCDACFLELIREIRESKQRAALKEAALQMQSGSKCCAIV